MKNRLKILYLCPYLPIRGIHSGGGRMFEILKRASQRHDISIISFVDDFDKGGISELRRYCKKIYTICRNPISNSSFNFLTPDIFRLFYNSEMERMVEENVSRKNFDILQFEYLSMAQYMPRRTHSVTVLTQHELNFLSAFRSLKINSNVFGKFRLLGRMANIFYYEAKFLSKFDEIITLTDYERRLLVSFFPWANVDVVNMGVDLDYFIPTEDISETDDLLFIGYFNHYPNVDAVLYFYKDILPLIRSQIPDVSFTVVGFNPPKEILKLSQDNNVYVEGFVEDIRPYLKKSKVFIMPVRTGAGMRGKLLEAWAMGKAVVSTSVGCEGLNFRDGTVLIADKTEDFAKKTITLLENPDLRKRLGENGRRTAESMYSWDDLSLKLEEIYYRRLTEKDR